jgi:putative membrane protein
MQEFYLEILAFHVISVLSLMAVLFYMPRLFVYHVENIDKRDFVDVVKIQEEKIYKVIGLPALIATVASGLALIFINPKLLTTTWFIAKLIALFLLIVYFFSMEHYRLILKRDECKKSGQFFRAYNEIPTLLSILIVVFVVTKEIHLYFSIGITIFFIFIMYKILTKRV